MYALIPIIIAIILGGLVMASSSFMSGDIYSDSNAETAAQITVKEGDKLLNAIEMYKFENSGVLPPSFQDLIDNAKYYKGDPGNWTMGSKGFETSVEEDVCLVANKKIGYEGPVPSCSSVPAELAGKRYYCCTN